MRSTATLVRKVLSVVAALVVLPVLGEWSIEAARAVGFYDQPLVRAQAVTAEVTSAPWFPWACGVAIGLAAGVWIDAWFRRFEAIAPELEWMSPLEARAHLIDPAFEAEIQRTLADHTPIEARSIAAQRSLQAGMSDITEDEVEACKEDSIAAWRPVEAAQWRAYEALMDLLRAGTLIARGMTVENGRAAQEQDVPIALWRVMMLSITTESAEGAGHQFLGLKIARAAKTK